MAQGNQLWMGFVDCKFDNEEEVMAAFKKMGESPLEVTIPINKKTGEPEMHALVTFDSEEAAKSVQQKLNFKMIPNIQPPARFKLCQSRPEVPDAPEKLHPVWIGDLSTDIDDNTLYKAFSCRYQSLKTAKVIMDHAGFNRGCGFVVFGHEDDQKMCILQMNAFKGLGSKTLRVSTFLPKPYRDFFTSNSEYHKYYPYWESYKSWQLMPRGSFKSGELAGWNLMLDATQTYSSTKDEDDLELVEHDTPVDVEEVNRQLTERDYNFWDALESSRWLAVEGLD